MTNFTHRDIIKGNISLVANKTANGVKMTLTAPADTVALVGAEYTKLASTEIFVDGTLVFENSDICEHSLGITIREIDEKYIYLSINIEEEKTFKIEIKY